MKTELSKFVLITVLYSIVGELLDTGESNLIDLSEQSSGVYLIRYEGKFNKIIKN